MTGARPPGGGPWVGEPLDHARAETLIAPHLPGADRARLEQLGSGDFCLAFRRGDQVVRVARHEEAAGALVREACIMPAIAPRLPLPVPQPTYHAPAGCPPFAVHAEVVGAVLTRGVWLGSAPDVRERASSDLAAFLTALHSLPTDIGRACGLARLDAARSAGRLRERAAVAIGPSLDRRTRRSLDAVLERWAGANGVEPRPPALLHGDIAPGHILYDPPTGALAGVIDFGDMVIGDPARDFVYVYEDFGGVILDAVLRHYAGPATPIDVAAIRTWYLLDAIAWTVEMHDAGRHADFEHGLSEIRRELPLSA